MRKLTRLILCAVVLTAAAHNAKAAIIDLIVEGGGTQQVYQLDNGNYLGLWGFENRGNTDPVTINTASELTAGFTTGTVVGYLDDEFNPFSFPFTVDADTRLFDSIWVEWTGGNLGYSFQGKSRTMSSNVTLAGDPTAVPEPGVIALLALGLLGLVALRRRTAV